HAYSALGRKDDAVFVWKQGYDVALNQTADLKQLLELKELLPKENTNGNVNHEEHSTGSPAPVSVPEVHNISETETAKDPDKLKDNSEVSSECNYMSGILKEDPNYPEALIGRGTAYAFQRELDAAIADFTKAIDTNPSAGEAWKRRGQARAALGDSAGAIDDLTKALEFEPDSADILHERGIVNFKFKDFGAAVKDLSTCVKIDRGNKSAYTYLGLSLSSIGEYKRAEESHKKALEFDHDFLEAWTHLTQLYQDLANTAKALNASPNSRN
ncbi:Suppressor of RPS4-RLD 1, partial [Bienertia sinuspersici]